jgi:predicted TPR repeat methyltransferase
MALLQAGRVAEAKAIFEALSRDARRDPDVWHLLGACHSMLGDDARGEECARKAVALMPSFAGAWVNLGSALLGQHKLAEAESALREAVKRAPADAQAHSNLGNVYREMKKTDEAEKCYREALRLQPNFPDALTNLGLIMQDRGELREAVALHRRALALNPQHVDAHYNLGYALILLGEAKPAIPHLERVTQLRPGDTRGWISLGGAYARVHDMKRAVSCYDRSVSLDPHNPESLSSLGVCCLAVGEQEKSIAMLTRALELNPDDNETRFWLAAAGVGEAPETISPDAVAKFFDGYADNFDEHLVGELQYRAPAVLNNALRRALGDEARVLSLLDVGCGTGLLGMEVKDITGYLAGIDLSPKMIEKARVRSVYDDLVLQDITDFLETTPRHFDAVVATDVFIYIGKLDRIFAATSARLVAGGLFAFSVEAHMGDEPYHLRTSGRYAQSLRYLRELSSRYGFAEVSVDPVVLRLENGVPMDGYVVVLRRLHSAAGRSADAS